MNVGIISCFFSNEMRINSVKKFFLDRGHSVMVIESDFVHLNKTYRSNPPEGHIYLHTKFYKKNLSVSRLLSHADFSKKVIKELENHDFDLLYVLVPPNSLIKEISAYKKWTNSKVVFDVIDLWPESLPLNVSSEFYPLAKWRSLRNKNINNADYIITQCDLYQKYFDVDKQKCRTVYFCKEKMAEASGQDKQPGKITLAYLGSINNLIDIEKIGETVALLAQKYEVTVHAIGAGHKTELFLEELKNNGASVVFHGEVYEPQQLAKIFSKCDFGINIYKPMTCIGMTLKSIDYFCYGLPIINSISCDTERLVKQYNAGINLSEFSVEVVEQYQASENRISELMEIELSPRAYEKKMEQILDELL